MNSKLYVLSFYRAKQGNEIGPQLETIEMECANKPAAIYEAKLIAKNKDWRLIHVTLKQTAMSEQEEFNHFMQLAHLYSIELKKILNNMSNGAHMTLIHLSKGTKEFEKAVEVSVLISTALLSIKELESQTKNQ